MGIKQGIKRLYVFLVHPVISVKLAARGVRKFVILPQMTINNLNRLALGDDVRIGRNSRFLLLDTYRGEQYVPDVTIGRSAYIGNRFTVLSAAPVRIGEHCLIADDVMITSENHGMNPEGCESYGDNPLTAKEVTIGSGCWIGAKAMILPGVTLGEKCVVAAGAVVNQSFPAYTVIAGVPARAIKTYNFETHQWEKTHREEERNA